MARFPDEFDPVISERSVALCVSAAFQRETSYMIN